MTPAGDLASTFEFLTEAKRRLAPDVAALLADGSRRGFERITFRPRLMVDVSQLDLTADVFGEKLFAPILAGPVAEQARFHPDAELATVRGAGAANTLAVISSRSSRNVREVAAAATGPLWLQIYADTDIDPAAAAQCKAVCLTAEGADWPAVERVLRSVKKPVVLKGIMDPDEARMAVSRGMAGIVVSNHGAGEAFTEPIDALPAVIEAVGGKVPVFVDGGFRRGTDVLKALALGARAVLVARPVLWGLAAYGAPGVEAVLRMLQTELARNMAMCGRPDIQSIDRSLVRIHRR